MTSVAALPTLSEADKYLEAVTQLLPAIKEASTEIEAARQLPPRIAELLATAGVFSVAVPRAWGGPGLPPGVISEGIEMLATADGSVGWCAMIGSDTGYFAGWLEDAVARELLGVPGIATAAVLNPSKAMARVTEGGFEVTGRWSFASGCTHASVYGLACIVTTESGPRMATPTMPELRVVFVPAAEAEIIDTWTTTGVRGSGSHDVALNGVFVPERRTSYLIPARPTRTEPFYRSPMAFLGKSAAVPLGIARGAIDDVIGMARTKVSLASRSTIAGQGWLHMAISQAEMNLQAARAGYFTALQTVWEATLTDAGPTQEMKIRLHLAQVNAFEKAVAIVDSMYRAGGSAALYAGSTLDRRLRDVHTISQHVLMAPENVAAAGQFLLGLEPELPVMLR